MALSQRTAHQLGCSQFRICPAEDRHCTPTALTAPGYLGYVFAGRALSPLFPDANTALHPPEHDRQVCGGHPDCAARLLGHGRFSPRERRLSRDSSHQPAALVLRVERGNLSVGNGIVIGGRLWSRRSAEGTLSELYVDRRRSRHHGAVQSVGDAFDRVPAFLYAWSRSKPGARARSLLLFAALFSCVGTIFSFIQPDFLKLLWEQFSGATAPSRMVGGAAGDDRTAFSNRNVRDTIHESPCGAGARQRSRVSWCGSSPNGGCPPQSIGGSSSSGRCRGCSC